MKNRNHKRVGASLHLKTLLGIIEKGTLTVFRHFNVLLDLMRQEYNVMF